VDDITVNFKLFTISYSNGLLMTGRIKVDSNGMPPALLPVGTAGTCKALSDREVSTP